MVKISTRERLADLEHEQWSHWIKYLLVERHDDKDRERWYCQARTDYKDLSKKEKESDRVWADKVIKLISDKLRFVLSRYDINEGSTPIKPKQIIKEVFS